MWALGRPVQAGVGQSAWLAQHVERFSDRFTKPAAGLRRRVRGDACTFLVEPAQSRRASGSRAAAAHRAFGGV